MVNNWLIDKLSRYFPGQCLVCGDNAQQFSLCPGCENDLRPNLHSCSRCAEPLGESYQHSLCGKCLKKSPEFDQVISPYLYQHPADRLVTRFKFKADHTAGHILSQLLVQYLEENIQQLPECLIPVPLHRSQLRQRGFNQSQEIARLLGKQLQVVVNHQLCIRQRKTCSQSGLNEKQRRRNIRGAFKIKGDLPYKHVAIVDDVMTTGNTVNELAKVLRKAGAETIQIWAICRASNLKN